MNPFACAIKKLRESRNLRQKEAAELLGYEQSYLSALENGGKSAPHTDFVNVLIKRYQLDPEETETLLEAWKRSERRFMLPLKASTEEYELFFELRGQMGQLLPHQIEMIKLALSLDQKVIKR